MKILFVFGGLPHYYNKILNKLNALPDYEISVVAPALKSKTIGSGVHETEDNITFKLVKLKEYKTFYGKHFFKGFLELIKEEKPDCLVIGWPYYLALIFNPFILAAVRRKGVKILAKEIPFSVPVYNESFKAFNKRSVASQKKEAVFRYRLWFFMDKLIRKRFYGSICDGAVLYTEDGIEIIASYGMRKDKITVIYNSPDTDDIFHTVDAIKSRENIEKHRNRIIHVGRLVDWKRVDQLIMAINQLKRKYPDIELIVIGKGEEDQRLKELVSSMELQQYVKFFGAVYNEEQLSREFLQSDIYVLAGMGGLSINEAMCHSLPVVCSVCDGTEKHLVFDNINGKYFIPDNIESMVIAIDSILSNQELKQKMGESSRSIIAEKINIHTVIQRYQESFSKFTN